MQNFKRKEVTPTHYEKLKVVQAKNGTTIFEQVYGIRRKLYIHGRLNAIKEVKDSLDIGNLTKPKFTAFIGMFQRNLYSQFSKNDKLYDLNIDFKGISRKKNMKLWDEMRIGEQFFNLDFSSAYWQFSHRLGYISTNLYTKYMDLDDYKEAKRYCISFLGRRNKMIKLEPSGKKTTMICDNSVLHRVYQNVRNSIYLEIANCASSSENILEQNIDGISVRKCDYKKVRDILLERGIVFKVKMLIKTSDKEYLSYDKIRKFRK